VQRRWNGTRDRPNSDAKDDRLQQRLPSYRCFHADVADLVHQTGGLTGTEQVRSIASSALPMSYIGHGYEDRSRPGLVGRPQYTSTGARRQIAFFPHLKTTLIELYANVRFWPDDRRSLRDLMTWDALARAGQKRGAVVAGGKKSQ